MESKRALNLIFIALTRLWAVALPLLLAPGLALANINLAQVDYACGSVEETHDLKAAFEDAMTKGAKRLEFLNPGLAKKLESAFVKNSLIVACECSTEMSFNPIPKGEFIPASENESGKDEICFNMAPGNLSLHAKAVSEHQMGTEITYPPTLLLEEANDNIMRGTIFHEALHFAEVGNLSRKAHDELPGSGKKKDDLVYACDYAVFPTYLGPIGGDGPSRVKFCSNFGAVGGVKGRRK